MSTEHEHFTAVLGRLSEPEQAELAIKPWLATCVRDGETTLELARERWANIQEAARLHLRDKGIQPQARMRGSDGEMRTTAIKRFDETEGQPPGVTVFLDDATWGEE